MSEHKKQFNSDRELLENIYQLQIINFHRIQHLEQMLTQLGAKVPPSTEMDDPYHDTFNEIDRELVILSMTPASLPSQAIPPSPDPAG